jgi:cyclic pyranopterin phosphate synthase
LRGPLRAGTSDAELAQIIATRWRERGDRYSERRAELRVAGASDKVEMYTIGG